VTRKAVITALGKLPVDKLHVARISWVIQNEFNKGPTTESTEQRVNSNYNKFPVVISLKNMFLIASKQNHVFKTTI
jgi:hypothetical protein